MTAPVSFDHLVARIQHVVNYRLAGGDPFSLQFEQFTGPDGGRNWRALLKLGKPTWAHSLGDHTSPMGALRELVQILEERDAQKRLARNG